MWTGLVCLRIGTGESSWEFGIEPSGKLSSGLASCGSSNNAQLHRVS
jgi:hypothetical protein